MEQIMEFFLNLLLFNGKFLTTTVGKTVHEAIKRCTEINHRLSREYQKNTKVFNSFENMLEMVNHSSLEYVGEENDNNLVISGEISCKLYEELNRIKQISSTNLKKNSNEFKVLVKDLPLRISKSEKNQDTHLKSDRFSSKSYPEFKFIKYKHPHHHYSTGTYIEENLASILKAQELLFKNIGKLVIYLEKQQHSNELGEIKHKLVACAEILSNYPMAIESKYVNNLVDDEITQCRFGQGDLETFKNSNIVKASTGATNKDESRTNSTQTPKKAKSLDVEAQTTNASQLLDVNQKQFTRTEDNLIHHKTIRNKCLALRDDYLNRCKCSYHNKKHFKQFEAKLKRKVQRQKEETDLTRLYEASDSMFEMVERRASLKEMKQEQSKVIAINEEAVSKLEEKLIEIEQRRKSEEFLQLLLEERQIMIRNSREIISPDPNQGEKINLINCKVVSRSDKDLRSEKKICSKSLEADEKLLKVNEAAFNDLETTLKTTQILKVSRIQPNVKKAIMDIKKRRFDQGTKKNLSTKQLAPFISSRDLLREISNHNQRTFRDDGSELFIETKGTILLKPKNEKPPLLISKSKSKTFSKVPNLLQSNKTPPSLASPKIPVKKRPEENFTTPMKLSEEYKKSRGQLKPRTTKTAMKKMQVKTVLPKSNQMKFSQVKPKTYQNLLSYRKVKARSVSGKTDKSTEKSEETINLIKWEEADSSTMSKVLFCNQV